MAIAHIAMFDAANAIVERHDSYSDVGRAPRGTSADAAVAHAAHDTPPPIRPSRPSARP